MSNSELSRHYINMKSMQGRLPTSTPANIIHALDVYCNGQWAWEVTDESFALDNTLVCTTVMLYIPGKILTGRSISPCKEYSQNHLKALVDACQTIMEAKQVTQPTEAPAQPQTNMSPTEIMGMINGNSSPAPAPQEQSSNGATNYNDLPFYFGPEEAPKETNSNQQSTSQNNVLNLFDGIDDTPTAPPQPAQEPQTNSQGQEYPLDYDTPKPHLNGFSQRQVDGVNAFKAKFEVVNDTMFNNYINAWNPNFTSKVQLTPMNVENFLKWTATLGEEFR